MAKELLAYEQREAVSALTNRHTLFFIPLQYWSFVLGILAIASLISDAIR